MHIFRIDTLVLDRLLLVVRKHTQQAHREKDSRTQHSGDSAEAQLLLEGILESEESSSFI